MKMWQFFKNVMLAILMTTLYAIWSTNELHEISQFNMWLILICVGLLIFSLLNATDIWFAKLERARHKERRISNEKISESTKRTQSTQRAI